MYFKYVTSYLTLVLKANGTLIDDIDGFVTVIRIREEEPFKIHGVVYSIIGFAAAFFYL